MASHAPITGAPAGAPPAVDLLFQFESVHGEIDSLAAVFRAASDAIPPMGEASVEGQRLLYAGQAMLDAIIERASATITAAYADLRSR